MKYLEDLRREFPHGALDLVQVPGLGPRKAVVLIRELDIANWTIWRRRQPKAPARAEGIRREDRASDPGRRRQGPRPPGGAQAALGDAALAEQLVERVRAAPGVLRAEIAGSVRRYSETNGDIDIVAAGAGRWNR